MTIQSPYILSLSCIYDPRAQGYLEMAMGPQPPISTGIILLEDMNREVYPSPECKQGKILPRRVNVDRDGEAFPILFPVATH